MNIYYIKVIILNLLFLKCCFSMNQVILDENSGFTLQWELNESKDEILIILSMNSKSWIGIGWGDENRQGMSNADYVIALFDGNGNLNISDMLVTDNQTSNKPVADSKVGGTNDILTSYGYQTSDYTYVKFTRKLVTGDTLGDKDIIITPGISNKFIWAKGDTNKLGYHGAGNRGEHLIDLNGIKVSKPVIIFTEAEDAMYYWHGCLMFASFMVLMPFGIFVGRFMKHYSYWFPVHYILLGSAFAFAVVGFILAFLMNESVQGIRFSKNLVHAWFGLFTIIIMTFVVALGVMSHLLWKSDRKKTPIFPDVLHAFSARLTYLLAIVSIFTGFDHSSLPKPLSIVLGITIALFFGVVIFLEIYKKRYPDKSNNSNNNGQTYSSSNFLFNENDKKNIELKNSKK